MKASRHLALLLLLLSGCTVAATRAPPTGPSLAASKEIQVIAGTYGGNCEQARGNVTDHLVANCEGRDQCHYRVDFRVIGDPAFGCRKDYLAEWRCGDEATLYRAWAAPEAGYHSLVTLACPGPPPLAPAPPESSPGDDDDEDFVSPPTRHWFEQSPPNEEAQPKRPRPRGGSVEVRSASYGENCGAAHGNVTSHLAERCDGRWNCAYSIDNGVIGDPAPNCRKQYVAEWTCRGDNNQYLVVVPAEAGLGSIVRLRCGASDAASAPRRVR